MIKKWPEPKRLKYQKICFFMPVNHAKYFLKSNHARGFSSWLFSETLNFYFQIVWPRRPSFFRQKMFAMLMSTSNLMHHEIWAKWSDSNHHTIRCLLVWNYSGKFLGEKPWSQWGSNCRPLAGQVDMSHRDSIDLFI